MLTVIEFLAVIASATYGVLLARKVGMDFVGVFSLAFIVAFGGGTLRDLFLGRHPLFWIKHDHYSFVVFSLAILLSLIPSLPRRLERFLNLPDALGLGLFSVVGAGFALESGTSLFVASLMGVVTGTFGGVIGDVVCNEVPSLFRPSTPLYATCAFLGSWAFLLLNRAEVAESISVPVGIAVVVLLRFAALKWNWRLPELRDHNR